jgi:L-alanine-DL-glutamate epimerase-like enolase superfamily enzyme
LILRNNAGPLGTAASLHAALTIPNVTLLEAPWANRDAETDVCWPYPAIVDGYALPLEGPGLGIEVRCTQRISVGRRGIGGVQALCAVAAGLTCAWAR